MDAYLTAEHKLLPVALMLGIMINGCEPQSDGMAHSSSEGARQAERHKMVAEQIIGGGIRDAKVIEAMRSVPRHRFVPQRYSAEAYADGALPIGYGQTISQPALVASMTESLQLTGTEKVLEVGTGSGYQAAILATIVPHVYSIEVIEPLARQAAGILAELGYRNVTTRTGDGYNGWPEEAPFDAIIVTAAPDHVPQPLLDQLAVGGRMILPVGEALQNLILYRRTSAGYEHAILEAVRFVPLVHDEPSQPAQDPYIRTK
jgi:protein-L-isoaspartate(D-aspartate) O-methyltransferase